jgi:hypothetical protein
LPPKIVAQSPAELHCLTPVAKQDSISIIAESINDTIDFGEDISCL